MKHVLLTTAVLFSLNSYAQLSAPEVLLAASASCEAPNNPMVDGLKALNGNSFGNVKMEVVGDMDEYTDAVVVTADVNFDPRIGNSMTGAPVRKLGRVDLFIGRWSDGSTPGTTQKCDLKVTRK